MRRFAYLFALLAGILWGSTGPFVRILTVGGFDQTTVFFARALLAAIILFFVLLIYDRSLFRIRMKDLWIFLIHSCLATAGLNICYNISITHMSLSLAAVLLALAPVYVVILAAFLFKEKLTLIKVVCMVLAIFGSILVSGIFNSAGASDVSASWFMIGILSGVLYAVQIICVRLAGDRGYHSLTLTFYCMLFATLELLFLADFRAIGHYVKAAPLPHFSVLLGQTLLCAIIPYLCIAFAVMKAEAGISSILAAAGEPAAATVFGAVVFHEIPTVLILAGLVLTIAALAILLRPETIRFVWVRKN